MKRNAIILAAGKGTRMRSKLYKVLHQVCGKTMVEHVVDQLEKADIENIITIVGFGADKVKEVIGDRTKFALQNQQPAPPAKPADTNAGQRGCGPSDAIPAVDSLAGA